MPGSVANALRDLAVVVKKVVAGLSHAGGGIPPNHV